MATVTIQPDGAAAIRPPETNFTLGAVIGGTGEVDDGSDATYVETIRRVVGHVGSGADLFDHTSRYYWDALTPAPELGDYPGEGTTITTRARAEVAANSITYDTGNPPFYSVGLTRISDDAIVAFLGGWIVAADSPAGPQWIIGTVEVGEEEWETLRTGVHPVYGDAGFTAGWSGSPATTLTNDVGDETRVRLYEFAYEYVIDTGHLVTRLFPRKDAYGPMGSAPRLIGNIPPERIVGGHP